ncbi:50S ribosomal protein L9 [Microbaculum marinisediminis]|uniref:Large ribosomal subunit protein bL9 n=1 Tax=Microbaculum marinisediminis TaxID=2931392 RepID=A0AAW5R3V4_9HYPH|nr:50S ribosomal protein L9 [Microbaculum sp. A6E488]MCT8973205.1 50S ribosomal protein L9 [Microbaculum sp. A6E488]
MEVILLERIAKLGQMGDVVRVRDGFARNFLLPQKKALRATETNRQLFEQQRAQLEARNLELRSEAEAVASKMNGFAVVLIRQASERGQLYGSVSSRDIADALTEAGLSVTRGQVVLNSPIKTLGLTEVPVRLHPEVDATVTVNAARSEEEAERQARGEDVTIEAEEEEELEAEEFFEEDAEAEAEETAETGVDEASDAEKL